MAHEYLSLQRFPGDGVTTDFTVNFAGGTGDNDQGTAPYINITDVKATEIIPATPGEVEVRIPRDIVILGPLTFRVNPPVPEGHILELARRTWNRESLVDFRELQAVGAVDLDTSARQLLFVVQESMDRTQIAERAVDQANLTAVQAVNTSDAALQEAQEAREVAGKAETIATQARDTSFTLRAPEPVPAFPGSEDRANTLAGFDHEGKPTVVVPVSGSAVDLAVSLANPAQGTSLVGYKEGTVREALEAREQFESDLANPDKGAAMVARGTVSVDSIQDLVSLPPAQRAESLRYLVASYTAGWAVLASYRAPVGGGEFVWDPLSSEDENGVTVFGSFPTGRFKRVHDNTLYATWGGAIPDATIDSSPQINNVISVADALGRLNVELDGREFGLASPINWDKRTNIRGGSGLRGKTNLRALASMPALINGGIEISDTSKTEFSRITGLRLVCNSMAARGISGVTNHSHFDLEVVGATDVGVYLAYGWNNTGRFKVYACSGSGIWLGTQSNACKFDQLIAFNIGGYGVRFDSNLGTQVDLLHTEDVAGPAIISNMNKGVNISTWYCEDAATGTGLVYDYGTVDALFHSNGSANPDTTSAAYPDNFRVGTALISSGKQHDCFFYVPGAFTGVVGNLVVLRDWSPVFGAAPNVSINAATLGTVGSLRVGTSTPGMGTVLDFIGSTRNTFRGVMAGGSMKPASIEVQSVAGFNKSEKTFADFTLTGTGTSTYSETPKPSPVSGEKVYSLTSEGNTTQSVLLQVNTALAPSLAGRWGMLSFLYRAPAGSSISVTADGTTTLTGSGEWKPFQLFIKIPASGEPSFNLTAMATGLGGSGGVMDLTAFKLTEIGAKAL